MIENKGKSVKRTELERPKTDEQSEASPLTPEDIYDDEVFVEHEPPKDKQDLRRRAIESIKDEIEEDGKKDTDVSVDNVAREQIHRARQQAVLPKEDFIEMFKEGEYTKEIEIGTGRVPWRFWQHSREKILDVSPPDGFVKEGAPPLVIIGGLGTGLTSYLENIYEAVTAGRRVIFMNPSRTFRARKGDAKRIHDLEAQSEKLMPEVADELLAAGEISDDEYNSQSRGGNIPDTFIRKASAAMQMLETLGVDRFDMIGHSQGGIVSAGIVALAGNRVRVWNPISPAGMHGRENPALLIARVVHEQVHGRGLRRFPRIYRALGIVAEKLGILSMLYRSEGVNRGEYDLEKYLAHPRPTEEHGEKRINPHGNKKMQKMSKVESFKPTRIGGMAWAGVRISQTDVVPLLHVMRREEGLRTKIPLMVAHGEATFLEDRILRNTRWINIWPYSTLDRNADHDFDGIKTRNVLEFLETEDDLEAEREAKEKEKATA